MSFFGFRNQNKFEQISKTLEQNERTSKAALHEKHPHTVNLFNKYDVDLRQIRKKGAKAAAAATILGAFLAFPHLLGNPLSHENKSDQTTQGVNIEKQVDPGTNHKGVGNQNPHGNNVVSAHSGSSAVSNPPILEDEGKHKSQGHIHGRSYMAPPKEHGYHDLGLHAGEEKGKGNAEAPGPHPEDLNINRGGNNQ